MTSVCHAHVRAGGSRHIWLVMVMLLLSGSKFPPVSHLQRQTLQYVSCLFPHMFRRWKIIQSASATLSSGLSVNHFTWSTHSSSGLLYHREKLQRDSDGSQEHLLSLNNAAGGLAFVVPPLTCSVKALLFGYYVFTQFMFVFLHVYLYIYGYLNRNHCLNAKYTKIPRNKMCYVNITAIAAVIGMAFTHGLICLQYSTAQWLLSTQ